MRVCLKVLVEDTVGYREGLPALLALFKQYDIQASFFFSLGYDNSGLSILRLYNPLALSRHLPLGAFFRGIVLPPTNLAKQFGDQLKLTQDAGHELGLASFDATSWQLYAPGQDQAWIEQQLTWASETFAQLVGEPARLHAASGYAINPYLFQAEQKMGFELALDTHGKTAFLPVYQGVYSDVMQLPVTLPAPETLLLRPEVNEDELHEYLFAESQRALPHGQVMAVRAAHEGRHWLGMLEKLLIMWRGSNWEFVTATELANTVDRDKLLTHQVGWDKYLPARAYQATQSLPLDIPNQDQDQQQDAQAPV